MYSSVSVTRSVVHKHVGVSPVSVQHRIHRIGPKMRDVDGFHAVVIGGDSGTASIGPDILISGNIDPTVLFGSKKQIKKAVRECIDKAWGHGKHLLNLGHGFMQGTPGEAVGWLMDDFSGWIILMFFFPFLYI